MMYPSKAVCETKKSRISTRYKMFDIKIGWPWLIVRNKIVGREFAKKSPIGQSYNL